MPSEIPGTENRALRVCTLLNRARARYLVVGGVAANLHGSVRATRDVERASSVEWNSTLNANRGRIPQFAPGRVSAELCEGFGSSVIARIPPRLAFFLPSLAGGGAERVMLNLATGFAERGFRTDLVLAAADGPYLGLVPSPVRTIDLKGPNVLGALRTESDVVAGPWCPVAEGDVAFHRFHQAGEAAQERGLPGPVASDETDDLPFRQG